MNGPNEILEAILTLHQATEAGFMRLDRLENRFDVQETHLTRVEAMVMHRFDAIDRRFDKVDGRLDDIDRRLAWVEHA